VDEDFVEQENYNSESNDQPTEESGEEPRFNSSEPKISSPEVSQPDKIEESKEPVIEQTSMVGSAIDNELEDLLGQQRAKIKVVGAGGAGNNTINRITEVGVKGSETIALNTDAQDLLYTSADKKLLIGRETTQGMGAGSNPRLGEEAAKENELDIKKSLAGADLVFITCGLGGGTGTGSVPVIADISKKMGALTVAIVTLPFAMEGHTRYENATIGLEKLEQLVDTLIVIPNDKLLELAPDLPLHTAFKVADEILTNAVKGIAELVTKAGLVNLDFADIRAVMANGGVALIGVGESDSEKRAEEAVEKAINNPLLDVDVDGASGALINVCGGDDMTLDDARHVVETISERLNEDAKIIWGAQIYKDLQKTIRVMLIITGVKSTQIFGTTDTISDRKKKDIENELGIDFVD